MVYLFVVLWLLVWWFDCAPVVVFGFREFWLLMCVFGLLFCEFAVCWQYLVVGLLFAGLVCFGLVVYVIWCWCNCVCGCWCIV